MQALDDLLRSGLGTVYSAASVEIRQRGAALYRAAVGTLDPDGRTEGDVPHTRTDTLFDFASLTKLFTTTAFFRLADSGRVRLDTPIHTILPEFVGPRAIKPYPDPLNTGKFVEVVPPTDEQADAGAITFADLLTHSSGLPAWINLRDADTEPARLTMCLTTPFAYPSRTRVIYSDVGFILIGAAVARMTDRPLDAAMKSLVIRPLQLTARYGPITPGNVAPTEFCQWRQRRLVGEVHDENAATLHGVSGHAGLFGTATDIALLGQLYLNGGEGFLSPRLVKDATSRHIEDRGLGWMMKSPQGSSAGQRFSDNSFGHTGFTGTSLWIDPQRSLIVALLTNRVFFGRNPDPIMAFRPRFHEAVIEALEG